MGTKSYTKEVNIFNAHYVQVVFTTTHPALQQNMTK